MAGPGVTPSTPSVYSQNAISNIIYPPNYDPSIGGTSVLNSPAAFANDAAPNFALAPYLQAATPKSPDDWLRVAILAGGFVLLLIYFGSYIVKHT